MKLVRLYSNQPALFPPIIFKDGLNVVLARVRQAEDLDRDSHNLGKTLLAYLLDFTLLKEVDKAFFLRKHGDRFTDFVFFLEILLPDEKSHLTIRRPCDSDTRISLKKHGKVSGDSPFAALGDEKWDQPNVPIRKAQQLVDSYLSFDVLPGWDYRKGVSYFLRTQHDYRSPFRVEKFQRSKDIEWKPYVADLLGLPGAIMLKKYDADRAAEGSEEAARLLQSAAKFKDEDYDRVRAQIERKEIELRQREAQVSSFSFHDVEMEISDDLVTEVESGIGRIEQELYYKGRDLQAAAEGLAKPLDFKAAEVSEIYRECAVTLPDQLVRSYADLEEFNRRLAKERNKYLKRRIAVLEKVMGQLRAEHQVFSEKRRRYLQVLKEKESLERFKRLQIEALRIDEELQQLKAQLERLSEISALRNAAREAEREAERLADQLDRAVHKPPSRYENIRRRFQEIVDQCLKVPAVLYVRQNAEGNLEFHADIERMAGSGEMTSEAEGSTYTKFLCMAFDLAILAEYSGNRFFHFVYHDGALEGLDDRKKLRLLDLVDGFCRESRIQYILSTIQHELPRAPDGEVIDFQSDVIIRELHDEGDGGRLFRMAPF